MKNILVSLNAGYLRQLAVLLSSLLAANPGEEFCVYVAHSSLEQAQLDEMERVLGGRCALHSIRVSDEMITFAPTSGRYPHEMYYRLFAPRFLPDSLDRILYLDPDIVAVNPIGALYNLDLGDNLFAASSHVHRQFQKFNEVRLGMEPDAAYVNSGVMLMNLALLRAELDPQEILSYIREHKNRLFLPDQDIINALYGGRILAVDPLRYNLSDKVLRLHNLYAGADRRLGLDWVRANTSLIHYCGRNKPWKPNYRGILDIFYREAEARLDSATQRDAKGADGR